MTTTKKRPWAGKREVYGRVYNKGSEKYCNPILFSKIKYKREEKIKEKGEGQETWINQKQNKSKQNRKTIKKSIAAQGAI